MNAALQQHNHLFFATLANLMVRDGFHTSAEELSSLGFRVVLESGPKGEILYTIFDDEDYEISFNDLLITILQHQLERRKHRRKK